MPLPTFQVVQRSLVFVTLDKTSNCTDFQHVTPHPCETHIPLSPPSHPPLKPNFLIALRHCAECLLCKRPLCATRFLGIRSLSWQSRRSPVIPVGLQVGICPQTGYTLWAPLEYCACCALHTMHCRMHMQPSPKCKKENGFLTTLQLRFREGLAFGRKTQFIFAKNKFWRAAN